MFKITPTVTGIIFCTAFLLAVDAFAHGGRLNKEGCHNNRKTGEYHCHRGTKAPSVQGILTGIPEVIDGDTIRLDGNRIRFHGIDAPEVKQTCTDKGRMWECGKDAKEALSEIIGKQTVSCVRKNTDRFGRIVAICRSGYVDLNSWMVLNGWAVAYRRFGDDYAGDEKIAKDGQKGIWRGEFVMPWKWRRR